MIKEYIISFRVHNITSGQVHNRKVVIYDYLETLARMQAIEFIHNIYSSRSGLFEFKIFNVKCNILQPRVI